MNKLDEFQNGLSVLLEACEKYDRGYAEYSWNVIRKLLTITFYEGEEAKDELAALRAERGEAVRLVQLLKESVDEIAYVLHDADRNTEEKVKSAKKVWLFFPVTRVTEFLAKVKP